MTHRLAVEFRSEVEGTRISGLAAVYGSYAPVQGHYETVAPGAFDRALSERQDVALTLGHNPNQVLARTKAGTLELAADKAGLRFRAELPDTTLGRDTAESLRRGDLDAMSFAFKVRAESWSVDAGRRINTVEDLDLVDVSIVGRPAYEGTSIHLRSLDTYPPAQPGHIRLVRARARLILLRGANHGK